MVTKRERRGEWARRAATVVGLGLVLGFAAPFSGDPPLSRGARYAVWLALVLAGTLLALAADRLVPRAGDPRRAAIRPPAIALLAALPLTFVAAFAIGVVRPGHAAAPGQLPALFAASFLVELAIVLLLLRPAWASGAAPATALVASPPRAEPVRDPYAPSLRARLSGSAGFPILALEAEDHYLRVHGPLGSELILMRLGDAIAAIDDTLGLRVHRGWWVAEAAVTGLDRRGQQPVLALSNGLAVPVGRTYAPAVRARLAPLPGRTRQWIS